MAMAKATYDLLLQFAPIDGVARSPRAWPEVAPLLDGFVRASTKSDKQRWFVAQGLDDVSFLEGITLPDGAVAFDQRWNAHKLTSLTALAPTQPGVDAALADFYRRFFTQWMTSDDFDALAKAFGAPPAPELAARLRAWRIRDHGRVAELAHQAKPLTAAQRTTLSALAKQRNALVSYPSPADAFFPLQVKDRDAAPLQAFLVGPVQTTARGTTQAAATAKLRHAPYDTIVVNAELVAGTWRIVGVDAIVDH
jgi:hypothetical protein